MISQGLTRFLAAGLLGLLLSACSQTGSSLAGDYTATSKCPPNGCASLDPDPTQLTISNGGKTIFYMTPATVSGVIVDQVQLGGDCYASSYPSNRIEVTVFSAGQEVLIQPGDIIATIAGANLYVPKCVNGRFGFSINGLRMPGGNTYKVQMKLIGIASSGAEASTSGGNILAVSVVR